MGIRFLEFAAAGLLLSALGLPVRAAAFPLPVAGEGVVGQTQVVIAKASDTLLDIARRFDVGYNEITAANPGVDPWLPKQGTRIVIPSLYVLPAATRRGIVINLAEMRLYYYPNPKSDLRGIVVTHPIGIGREGWSTPLGLTKVASKHTDPTWTVPASIRAEWLAEGVKLPKVVPPGPNNPLGRYAIRLAIPGYLIHGTNRPYSVGMRVSHGCLRMYPEDIEAFYKKVPVGTPVRIIDRPYKIGQRNGTLYLEAHSPLGGGKSSSTTNLTPAVAAAVADVKRRLTAREWERVFDIAAHHTGMPTAIDAHDRLAEAPPRVWVLRAGAFHDRKTAERFNATLQGRELPGYVAAGDDRL